MPLHKGKKKMSPNANFAISSGVEPVLTAPSAASPKKTRLLHEREQPTSPEKKERRRKQVRLAQRAYRARNEANTTLLKQRIARLEFALERQSRAVVLFSDFLAEDSVVISRPHVADRLRETVKICLDSAIWGDESEEDIGHLQLKDTSFSVRTPIKQPLSPRDYSKYSHPHIDLSLPSAGPRIQLLPLERDRAIVEAPVFVQYLRISCLYQGFLMLKNPSVPLNALRRPFRFLLSLVPRETITLFFYNCLYARLNHNQPDKWTEIPFFRLGGAGTHYREVLSSRENNTEAREPKQQYVPVEHGARSAFSLEAQEELEGDWFDIWDLAGYLRSEGITLSTAPPTGNTADRKVNALDFTAALVEKGICLGRSPGFKRSDVEAAISLSSWR
ncbi:hypothetical protein N7532_001898 [Penicillium argentinense]|uniref:BZIP domain-containing protein n=1 Tax=Penicillium argentinense TaxID=1131581 RepID=A0A9W9G3J7_9EURO|nr:uncharacterized protein N7532_001898 [Penicillium argentinense]KAJ5111363.1 hypothetical protein N7532_001898 [Penicillium argentinense]